MVNMFVTREQGLNLVREYGSPLYIYSEELLRERASALANLCPNINFKASYSVKANSNVALLKIIRECGLYGDAMSIGEIKTHMEAGFAPEDILFVGNNVSATEMKYAVETGCKISMDSISQLETYAAAGLKTGVSLRLNTGEGLGHNEKVVTAGKNTKFGINASDIDIAKKIAADNGIKIIGINQHLGSLFLTPNKYVEGAKNLLKAAALFGDLEFVDFGGGFGVPYRPEEQELDMKKTGEMLEEAVFEFLKTTSKQDMLFKAEPGRYVVAECGALLGEITGIKENSGVTYVGTDIGFNVISRPILYDSYHHIDVLQNNPSDEKIVATVAGNVCESGDVLAKNRELQKPQVGDVAYIHTAGAYCYSMSSNYNCRLRPAEVLLCKDGTVKLIRKRETVEGLFAGQIY